MGVVKGLLLVVAAIILIALLGAGCTLINYTRVIGYQEDVGTQWAQVERQLQRRFDAVGDLQETVEIAAAQQQPDLFHGIRDARTKYERASQNATVAKRAELASQMEPEVSAAVARLLFLQQTYPELKKNDEFLKAQSALERAEDRLVTQRQRYNETVRRVNTFGRQFPGKFLAQLADMEPATYYEAAEKAEPAPKVDFSNLKQ